MSSKKRNIIIKKVWITRFLACVLFIPLFILEINNLSKTEATTENVTVEVVECSTNPSLLGTRYSTILKYEDTVQVFHDVETYAACKGKRYVQANVKTVKTVGTDNKEITDKYIKGFAKETE